MTEQISPQLMEIIHWTTIGLIAVTAVVALIFFSLVPDAVKNVTSDKSVASKDGTSE